MVVNYIFMKIVTLVENCVYGRKLQAEHGLSLYIETPEAKILFDTGQSDLFIRNARFLHVDLKEVDMLVLSHGHSDHSGGLHAFLEYNQKAVVYCKREALDRKFKGERENGMEHPEKLDLSRFRFLTEQTEVSPNVFVLPKLEIVNPEDTHFECFDVLRNGVLQPDRFEDEQALVIREGDKLVVLSACSHRGITNIIEQVKHNFPGEPVAMVIGGYHIHKAAPGKCSIIADYFKTMPDTRVGVCHCTGVDKFAVLAGQLGERVFYNHTGLVTETV